MDRSCRRGLGRYGGAEVVARAGDVRAGAAELLDQLRPHVRRVLADMAEYAELRADLATVHDPLWRSESTTERCARTLARSGDPMTPGELRDVMNRTGDEPVSAAALRQIMGAHPVFVRLPGTGTRSVGQ